MKTMFTSDKINAHDNCFVYGQENTNPINQQRVTKAHERNEFKTHTHTHTHTHSKYRVGMLLLFVDRVEAGFYEIIKPDDVHNIFRGFHFLKQVILRLIQLYSVGRRRKILFLHDSLHLYVFLFHLAQNVHLVAKSLLRLSQSLVKLQRECRLYSICVGITKPIPPSYPS